MWPHRHLRSPVRRRFGALCVVRSRLRGTLAVVALSILAAGITMAGCSPVAGEGTVSARTTATSSLPAATPSTNERLAALARAAFGGGVQESVTTYDARSQVVKVTGTLDGNVPVTASAVAAAQERTKVLCFRVQRALWTSGITLREVTVFVRGPAFDDYGNQYVDNYGTAVLGAAGAGRFSWDSVGADSAWTQYDAVWLRPSYEPNWRYGAPPAATPTLAGGAAG